MKDNIVFNQEEIKRSQERLKENDTATEEYIKKNLLRLKLYQWINSPLENQTDGREQKIDKKKQIERRNFE